jgi:acetyltransferase-like isoleucine patch superfamily enzyme
MLIEHAGKRPHIDPSAWVAPDATVCGDVTLGAGTRILHGARIIGEGGGAIRIGLNCIVMENAVIRASRRHSCSIGDHCLIGPNAHVTGAEIEDEVFLQLADPLLGLSDNRTCIRAPVFRNASAYFRMRNHGHAIRLRFFGRITGNDLESRGELTSPFETIARFESEHGPSLRFRRTKHFLSERKLSGSISSLL